MIVRPSGVVIGGHLELGVELVIEGGHIVEIRPHTGIPDPYVVSSAFVNAHSHLEYRGLLGRIDESEYWPWIREITRLKREQTPAEVAADCLRAAQENLRTGVAFIGEHTDRPGAAQAMTAAGLRGVLFQEVITFAEQDSREEKLTAIEAKVRENLEAFSGPVFRAPHAIYTVDEATLREIAAAPDPVSIHVAETEAESELVRDGAGVIAEFWQMHGRRFPLSAPSVVQALDQLGLARQGNQFVHCCDIDADDVELLANRGVSVAHCPRSNLNLDCPPAPVREMLDAGIQIGLGLDSAASSGPIDMFAEMRAALEVAEDRGEPVHPEEVWRMATSMGRRSLPLPESHWEIGPGAAVPLIAIHVADALHIEDVIRQGAPEKVKWLSTPNKVPSSVV